MLNNILFSTETSQILCSKVENHMENHSILQWNIIAQVLLLFICFYCCHCLLFEIDVFHVAKAASKLLILLLCFLSTTSQSVCHNAEFMWFWGGNPRLCACLASYSPWKAPSQFLSYEKEMTFWLKLPLLAIVFQSATLYLNRLMYCHIHHKNQQSSTRQSLETFPGTQSR